MQVSVPGSTLSSEDGATFFVSPSGLRSVVFRAGRVDVCDKLGVVFSVDTTKTHGKLLTASIFESIAWNPSEDRVVYVAKPLYPDVPSFWDTQKECDDNENEETSDNSNDNSDSKFCWREDWESSTSNSPRLLFMSWTSCPAKLRHLTTCI